MHVTLRQVAAAAGVSLTTASLSVREHPRIPVPTRLRVSQAVAALGYKPDAALSRLASLRWGDRGAAAGSVLAIIDSQPESGGIHETICDGAAHQAERLGYQTERVYLREWTGQPLDRALHHRGIPGVIVVAEKWNLPNFDWTHFSAVTVSSHQSIPAMHRVCGHVGDSSLRLWDEAWKLGYRRIGAVLLKDPGGHDNLEKLGAIRYRQELLGLRRSEQVDPLLIPLDDLEGQAWSPALKEWLRVQQPDAVLGFTDTVCWWLRELGHSIPGPLGYASIAADPRGDLAGMTIPGEAYGAEAVRIVDSLIRAGAKGLPAQRHRTQITMTWRPGPSLERTRTAARATA